MENSENLKVFIFEPFVPKRNFIGKLSNIDENQIIIEVERRFERELINYKPKPCIISIIKNSKTIISFVTRNLMDISRSDNQTLATFTFLYPDEEKEKSKIQDIIKLYQE